MSNDLLSFIGWAFLPDFITTNLQWLYYKLTIRTGDPVPQPGSPRHAVHRRRIYIAVIVIYLLYTIYEADWEVRRAGDFYTQLGVAYDVDEKALQSRFRRLTLLHHPDKLPQSATAADRAMVEQRYVQLQLARDTLVDPAKRFGYDRFGPDVTQWKHCTTIRDFVYTGMRGQIGFYIASVLIMPIMAYMGFGDWGQYWRYLSIAALAAIELHTITRPTFTFITRIPTLPLYLLPLSSTTFPVAQLGSLFNMLTGSSLANLVQLRPYLPFQALRVAHRATIAFFIALNRLGPVLSSSMSSPFAGDEVEGDTSDEALAKAFGFMERTVQISAAEAHRLLGLELVPFSEEAGSGRSGASGGQRDGKNVGTPYLREKLKEWFVTNTIRNDKEVEDAVERVIERRKGDMATAADSGGAGFVEEGDAYDQE